MIHNTWLLEPGSPQALGVAEEWGVQPVWGHTPGGAGRTRRNRRLSWLSAAPARSPAGPDLGAHIPVSPQHQAPGPSPDLLTQLSCPHNSVCRIRRAQFVKNCLLSHNETWPFRSGPGRGCSRETGFPGMLRLGRAVSWQPDPKPRPPETLAPAQRRAEWGPAAEQGCPHCPPPGCT